MATNVKASSKHCLRFPVLDLDSTLTMKLALVFSLAASAAAFSQVRMNLFSIAVKGLIFTEWIEMSETQ